VVEPAVETTPEAVVDAPETTASEAQVEDTTAADDTGKEGDS
jgi:hypothetical protein